MGKHADNGHLTPERIQDFLDQGLTSEEAARVEMHLAACARCRSKAEDWTVLFSELGALPRVAPQTGFAEAVMGEWAKRRPFMEKLRRWLRKAAPALPPLARPSPAHLPAATLHDYLDGVLGRRARARAQEHLAGCLQCQRQLQGWESLYAKLRGLERLTPSPVFPERVMAAVRIPAPARALEGRRPRSLRRAWAGVQAWVGSILPATRRGWAIVAGVASAPTITIGALVFQVFSHPSLSLGNLTAYLLWKGQALLSTATSLFGGAFVDSLTAFRAYSLWTAVTGTPWILGLAALLTALGSGAALWVLYRNLVSSPPDHDYARVRL